MVQYLKSYTAIHHSNNGENPYDHLSKCKKKNINFLDLANQWQKGASLIWYKEFAETFNKLTYPTVNI